MKRRSIVLGVPLGAVAPALFANTRPVTVVVPYPAGGTTDKVGRYVANGLTERLGQNFLVLNKPGAGGTIGISEVARAPADGSMLGIVYDSHAVDHLVYPSLPYHPFRSFEFVSLVVTAPHVLVTSARTPHKTLDDLIAAGKAGPNKVTYGAIGEGTSTTLNAALFAEKAGFQALRVPYNGGGGAYLADLLAGRFDYIMGALPAALAHIESGQLRALAYGGPTRSTLLPNVPTLGEIFPGMEAASWVGVVAPAGLPKAKVDQLSDAIRTVVHSEPLRQKLVAEGFVVQGSTSAQFLERARADSELQSRLLKRGANK